MYHSFILSSTIFVLCITLLLYQSFFYLVSLLYSIIQLFLSLYHSFTLSFISFFTFYHYSFFYSILQLCSTLYHSFTQLFNFFFSLLSLFTLFLGPYVSLSCHSFSLCRWPTSLFVTFYLRCHFSRV